jgi:hypothetical protein
MKSGPRRIVRAIADALLEVDDCERLGALEEEVSTFVSAAAFATRTTLALALACLRWAPLLLLMSWRPLERLARARRREVLERVERSSFGLVLVPWRTLLLLHFYEDTRELARIGYRDDRKRHLAVIPVPVTSGVRLKDDASGDFPVVQDDEKGAA